MRGNLDSAHQVGPTCAADVTPESSADLFHNDNHYSKGFNQILKTIKLVVVMSAVELWKAQQPLSYEWCTVPYREWQIVGIDENGPPETR